MAQTQTPIPNPFHEFEYLDNMGYTHPSNSNPFHGGPYWAYKRSAVYTQNSYTTLHPLAI